MRDIFFYPPFRAEKSNGFKNSYGIKISKTSFSKIDYHYMTDMVCIVVFESN